VSEIHEHDSSMFRSHYYKCEGKLIRWVIMSKLTLTLQEIYIVRTSSNPEDRHISTADQLFKHSSFLIRSMLFNNPAAFEKDLGSLLHITSHRNNLIFPLSYQFELECTYLCQYHRKSI